MIGSLLDRRPALMAIAGPNGAGKSTFFRNYIAPAGVLWVNADELARELGLPAYEAAKLAGVVRSELVRQRESFAFETVFSDPVGDKLAFLAGAAAIGYNVILCFIGLESAELSEIRVAVRVAQGGHDVPREKLIARFPRSLTNLRAAVTSLPYVLIIDNTDLQRPFRKVAEYQCGEAVKPSAQMPEWLCQALEA